LKASWSFCAVLRMIRAAGALGTELPKHQEKCL
jgi:hypothetical protein